MNGNLGASSPQSPHQWRMSEVRNANQSPSPSYLFIYLGGRRGSLVGLFVSPRAFWEKLDPRRHTHTSHLPPCGAPAVKYLDWEIYLLYTGVFVLILLY